MKVPRLRPLVLINNIQMKVMDHWQNYSEVGIPE